MSFNQSQNSDDSLLHDPYESYAYFHDPEYEDGQVRRPKRQGKAPKRREEVVAQLADTAEGLEAGITMTYQPARYETKWLGSSVSMFYGQMMITDVVAQVKGGKEASVYRCRAHPSTGQEWLAAKVYRPRRFRNLRNDKLYREGRTVLDVDGRPVHEDDVRAMRALEKGTAFGAQLAHTSWLMHEYTTMDRLFQAGGDVPKPFASSENAILMSYCGDAHLAAPTLHEAPPPIAVASRLFERVLHNVELMLQHDLIHGDLSAYNILYWEDTITIIDFPQVVDIRTNRQARVLLQRDLTRVCDFFAGLGVPCDARAMGDDLWRRYTYYSATDVAAELSRWQPADDEES